MQFSGKNSRRGGSACWEGNLGIEHLACLATWWGSCRRLRGGAAGDGDGDGEDSAGDEKKVDGSDGEQEEGVEFGDCGDGEEEDNDGGNGCRYDQGPAAHLTLICSQPFHGVHCVGDSLLLWTTFKYDKRDGQPTKVLNKVINIKDSQIN